MAQFGHIWTEENHYYYDLPHIFANYGERSEKAFGYGISQAFLFAHEKSLEFFLDEKDISETANFGFNYFKDKEKAEKFLADAYEAKEALEKECRDQATTELFSLEAKQLWEKFDYLGLLTGKAFLFYVMTQPQKIAKIEQNISQKEKENVIYELTPIGKEFSDAFSQDIDKIKLDERFFKEDLFLKKGEEKELLPEDDPGYFSRLVDLLGNFRFEMRFAWMKAGFLTRLYLKEMIKRGGISSTDLAFYEEGEIIKLLFDSKKVDRNVLEERRKGYLLILEGKNIQKFVGQDALEKYRKLNKSVEERLKEFTGVCACPGKTRGEVVILSYADTSDHAIKMENMPENSILVTQMTRPNIIVACKKASAIVTDEGGLLCHAAIISRELHKPCVIGTKIATEVLHDGDMIEVDADNGIVKVLESI